MTLPRRAAALALAAVVGTGCALQPPAELTTPAPGGPASPGPTAGPTAEPTPTASASPAPLLDLTRPGAARDLVDEILATAGANRAVMVTVTADDASVAVLKAGLSSLGLQAHWQTFFTGVVVIGAVLMDNMRVRAAQKVKT